MIEKRSKLQAMARLARGIAFAACTTISSYASAQCQIDTITASDASIGDSFGSSVSIDGDLAIVGAVGDRDAGPVSGSAYIFQRDTTGQWNEVMKLTAPDAASPDQFGASVAISGNYAIVGAVGFNSNSGSAYLFHRDQGGVNTWGHVTQFIPQNAAPNDFFGSSVAIEGDTLFVGAPGIDGTPSSNGVVYVYYRNQGGLNNWGELTILSAPAAGFFGRSVAISGDTVIVAGTGTASLFYRDQGGFDNWGLVTTVFSQPVGAEGVFGTSVAIEGSIAVVGAGGHATLTGSAHVLHRNQDGPDAWGQVKKLLASDAAASDRFGDSVAVSGDLALIGADGRDQPDPNAGIAYMFARNQDGPNNWGEVAIIQNPLPSQSDRFANSVSFSGDVALIGAIGANDVANGAGAAYLYVRKGLSDCNGNMQPDACDIHSGASQDCNQNGLPDECEIDTDLDGTIDDCDGCPNDPNKLNPGQCGCGNLETDTDNDGSADCIDNCPSDPNKIEPGVCGCGVPDVDSDGDGILGCLDSCPNQNASACDLNKDGCIDDADGDSTPDCSDNCPNDPNKIDPGQCGCGNPETDTDGDSVADCIDNCPSDPNKIEPGVCGCGVPDVDSDGDGILGCLDSCPKQNASACDLNNDGCIDDADGDSTPDCFDNCPNDPNKVDPGQCGCGNSETDTDNDGSADCIDNCPSDPNKTEPGVCGCGVPDIDSDGDGFLDCQDNCPNVFNDVQDDCDNNGVGNACETDPATVDCNENGIPDNCDINDGTSIDKNDNKVPDDCEGDCNNNFVPDSLDIQSGTSQDCNANLVPDECDIEVGRSDDCNANLIPDECEPDCNLNNVADSCDLASGLSCDRNNNDVLDECETYCLADLNCNSMVNVDDLLSLIGAWGPNTVPADLDENNEVNVNDLLILIGAWGPCP